MMSPSSVRLDLRQLSPFPLPPSLVSQGPEKYF